MSKLWKIGVHYKYNPEAEKLSKSGLRCCLGNGHAQKVGKSHNFSNSIINDERSI